MSVVTLFMCGLLITYVRTQMFRESKAVYEWATLEFDWPSNEDKLAAIENGTYVPERSVLAGIKVYRGDVYLTIPRWFWTNGHPVTLAKVVNVNNQTKLRPYPNWAAQKQGNCSSLQYVQSMEIDPNTGLMYVIDSGRIGNVLNLCPAKIVIYDLNTDVEVENHEMPADLVSRTNNFLNDIVLDYVEGSVRYVYITDNNEGNLLVYDLKTRRGYTINDKSMKQEGGNASIIRTNGKDYNFSLPINGITMSSDFKYVYYTAVAAFGLYQIPTATLRNGNGLNYTGIRPVGRRISQTGGLAYGQTRLFYGALALNAIYYWDIKHDLNEQKLPEDQVQMKTQVELVRDDLQMQWPDTFSFDQEGWLWFVSNRLHTLNRTAGLPNDGVTYMRVWKVYINETGYLYQADQKTQGGHKSASGLRSMTVAGPGYFLPVLLSFIHLVLHKTITEN